jgi:hypothetical protein
MNTPISLFLELFRTDSDKRETIEKDFKRLFTFSIDLEADEFSSLIEQIYVVSTLAFEFGP